MVRSSTNIKDYRTKRDIRQGGYIKREFYISLSTEDSMLNASETAVCNFSELYWCSK